MKRSALLALAIPLIALSLPALVLPRALAQVTNSNYQTSYTGDGVTTVYSFNWRLIDPTQMFVQVNGSTVNPSTYTVFQNSNGIGGTVTFATAPPIGQTILIQRNSDYLQQTTLLNNAALPPATLQEMVDKLTIECQQLSLNSSSGGGSGTVTSLIASGANWPTWLIPSVATATTTPNLSVNAGTMSGDAVSINQSGVATLAQPLHNLVGYNSTGIIVQTAMNTFASRALSSPNGTLSLGNINGASGNPTLDLPVQGGVTPGAYTNVNATVDAYGRLTAVANGSGGGGGSGTVNSGTSGNGVLYPGTGTTVGPNVNQNWTAGAETIGQSASVGGSTQWEGATSGFVKVQPPAVAGSTTITLPTSPTNGYVVTTNGSGVWSYAAPSFTKFQSAQQTLTSGGTLTLAHSLGSMPSLVYFNLVCTTNNGGYTAGQVLTPFAGVQANNQGVSFTTDATNVYVQFGSATNIFEANNGSGGASIGLANADWKLVVYAVI